METDKNKYNQPTTRNTNDNSRIIRKQTKKARTGETNNSERKTEKHDTDVFTKQLLADSYRWNGKKYPYAQKAWVNDKNKPYQPKKEDKKGKTGKGQQINSTITIGLATIIILTMTPLQQKQNNKTTSETKTEMTQEKTSEHRNKTKNKHNNKSRDKQMATK